MELKTNTAVRIPVGPLVDPTDGKTAETALTVTALSVQIYQTKTDGSAVVRTAFSPTASGGSNDMALVASSTDGMYDLELTAAQLNFLGNARLSVYDVDGFLVWWVDIQVVSANYFNNKYGSTIETVNITQIGGDSQSATDLKDFADAGYDPSTNKVQGVVLTDTCTTLTGHTAQTGDSFARIGATGSGLTSTAQASVCSETRLSELDQGTAGKMANQVDIIQTDTTTDIPGTISTMQGNVTDILTDTGTTIPGLIADLDTVIDRVEADTQDLQTQIGTDGAGLTNLPAVTLANGAHGGAGTTITLQTPIAATVPDNQKVDVNTIKTATVAASSTVTFQNGTIPITTDLVAGSGDWTANEKTALRAILGMESDSATPVAPTAGVLFDVDADVEAIKAKTDNLPDDPADQSLVMAGINDIPTVAEFEARTLVSAEYTVVSDLGVVQTADHTAVIADIPTVAEFNARTLPSADYLVESDTLAAVTTVGSVTTKTGYSLHSDYDAAKTAAQAGDEMDLVDAPNATAVTAIQSGLAPASEYDTEMARITADVATEAKQDALIATVGAAGAGLTALSTQASVDAIKAETALIVEDTNELQTDDIPGVIAALDTVVDGVEIKIDIMQENLIDILVDFGTTLQDELNAIQAAVITNAAGVDIAADIIAIKAETANILTDTGTTLENRLIAIETDTSEIGVAGAGLTESGGTGDQFTGIPKTGYSLAADQSAVTIGTVTTLTGHTPQTADHTASIADILTDTGATLDGKLVDLLEALVYKQIITEANGDTEIFNVSNASQGTVSTAYTSDGTYTQRLKLVV